MMVMVIIMSGWEFFPHLLRSVFDDVDDHLYPRKEKETRRDVPCASHAIHTL